MFLHIDSVMISSIKVQNIPYIDFQVSAPLLSNSYIFLKDSDTNAFTCDVILFRQHDALSVFDDVAQGTVEEEKVWVSCYQTSRPSVHGKIRLLKDQSPSSSQVQGVSVDSQGGIHVTRKTHRTFTVSCPPLSIPPTTVRFPRQTIAPVNEEKTDLSPSLNINCIDVSPDGRQIVYGGPDGYCRVETVSSPSAASSIPVDVTSSQQPSTSSIVKLKGHVGDVLSTRWFPSGQVVLTSSSDATLRIFSSLDGSNPRTLKGHKRAVTCTSILGVGKNVLSGSKDGSVRLWDVSKGVSVNTMYVPGFAAVEKIAVGKGAGEVKERVKGLCRERANASEQKVQEGNEDETEQEVPDWTPTLLEGEIISDTEDKLVFAALASSAGHVSVFDLSSKRPIIPTLSHIPTTLSSSIVSPSARSGAITAIAYEPSSHLLATGSSKGLIAIRDVRMISSKSESDSSLLHIFTRNPTGVNDLTFINSSKTSRSFKDDGLDLIIASAAGLPCRVSIPSSAEKLIEVVEEYAGWDAVPIESISVGTAQGDIWVGGGEGGIRRY